MIFCQEKLKTTHPVPKTLRYMCFEQRLLISRAAEGKKKGASKKSGPEASTCILGCLKQK
nr:MAG TPA: hypothetical protein [Caudoviricetes sp.]